MLKNRYHVHICCIGKVPEMTLAFMGTDVPKDRVIILNTEDADPSSEYVTSEESVLKTLGDCHVTDVEVVRTDVYDLVGTMEKLDSLLREVESKKSGCMFHFNITAGTNIVAGVMCILAQSFPNCDIYHLRKGEYCKPPNDVGELKRYVIGDSKSLDFLKSSDAALRIMNEIRNGDGISSTDLSDALAMKPQLTSYHLKKISKHGLIERGGGAKTSRWMLTEKGEAVMRRFDAQREVVKLVGAGNG